jgi:hypothetical protein
MRAFPCQIPYSEIEWVILFIEVIKGGKIGH